MSREWRVVIETGAAEDIAAALRSTDLDVDHERNVVYCYVDAPHNPKRVRKELKHDLATFGFAENVPDSLPIEHWDERQERYVDVSGAAERKRLPASLEPYEIRWAFAVEPSSVFETRKLREELRIRRRHEIGETKSGVEIGARDEADARALCEELGRLPIIGSVSVRKLGWFDRWQVREHLAGNYTGPPDPTQPGFY